MSSKIAIKDKPAQTLDSIGAKLSRVFDAAAVSSLTLNVNNVTQWNNIAPNAGSGTNLTQPTAANQPVYDRINRRISVGGSTSKFLNFNGFSAGFNGSIYIGTTSGIYAYDITIPSGSPDSFEWGRRETGNSTVGVIVTGIVICQTLNQVEESILNRWFAARGSIGFINYSRIGVTNLYLRFNSFNFNNGIDLGNTLHKYVTQIRYVFYSVTYNVTNMDQTYIGNERLQNFPLIDTALVSSMISMCQYCVGLTTFSQINTQSLVSANFTWYNCVSLVNFPPLNFIVTTNFNATWYTVPLSQLSLDNILISIAAGLSNNPNKNMVINSNTFSAVAATPTTINRRANESDWQSWETANNTALSGTALRNINVTYLSGTPNAVTYNFSAGISGQQARLWMIAGGVLAGGKGVKDTVKTAGKVAGAAAAVPGVGLGVTATMAPDAQRSQKRLKTAIALHVPNQLSVRYGVQWSEDDTSALAMVNAGGTEIKKTLS